MSGVAPLALAVALPVAGVIVAVAVPVAGGIVCLPPAPSLLCGIAAGLVADTSVNSDGGRAQQPARGR